MATAAVAGSIEYLVGLDDTQLVQGLARLPQRINQAGGNASQAAQRVGTQAGGAMSQAMAAALGQQLQTALRARLQAASASLPDIQVGADTSDIDRGLAQVRTRMQALSSQRIGIDVDAATADRQIGELLADLRQVAAQSPDIQVRTSAEQAIRQLDTVRSAVRALPDGTVRVEADTDQVREAMRRLGTDVQGATEASGAQAGESLVDGLRSKVAVIGSKAGPIVAAVTGALSLIAGLAPGVILWNAIEDGLQQEARNGLFKAQTGLDVASVARYARAAGESYAHNFGESVDDNLEAARAAFGANLLGGDSAQTEITDLTNKLQTVAQILGEEVPAVARAAGQAVRTGLVGNATEAFDLITKAQQRGLNVSEDLLDTITEYGTQFRRAGIDGQTAFGIISQLVKGGARDTDLAADAVKEFVLRLSDVTNTGAQDALKSIGLNAQDTSELFLKGGDSAEKAMQRVVDAIKSVEDPTVRNTALINLFGTQAEDLGGAINSLDFSHARAEFGDTAGVIDQAMQDIGGNAAGSIETAKRSIETSLTGVKAALAAAFGPEIARAADWVSSNREAMTTFAFEAGQAFLSYIRGLAVGTAQGLDTLSRFAPVFKSLGTQVIAFAITSAQAWKTLPFTDNDEADRNIANLRELGTSFRASMDQVQVGAKNGADAIRDDVLPAVDAAQDRFDAIKIPAVAQAQFSDATARLGQGLDGIGNSAAQTQGSIERFTGTVITSSDAGRKLDGQLRTVATSMLEQATSGATLGQTQAELTGRYNEGRDALIKQLQQMGLTREEADRLAASYGLVPGAVDTIVSDRGTADAVRNQVQKLNAEIGNIKDRTVTIKAMLTGVTPAITGGRPAAQGQGGSGGTTAYATGGPVWGAGTATSDSIDAKLSNGEHVWTAAEVTAAGGQDRVRSLRRAALAGALPHFAAGGAVGATTTISMPSAAAMLGAQNSMLKSFAAVAQKAQEQAQAATADVSSAYVGNVGKGVERWRATVLQALQMMGLPASLADTTLRRMNQESGGNPNIVNNWDINAKRGTPSGGLMQTIAPTFKAYHFPGTSWNMFDPLANILASMRYALARYGSLPAAYNKKGGYAAGGPVSGPGTGTSDSIDAKLSNGEHVWTAAEVRAAGGHGRVEALRRTVRGYAEGGTVTGSGRSVSNGGNGFDLPAYLTRQMNPQRTTVDDAALRKANLNAVTWTSNLTMAEAALAEAKQADSDATDALREAESKAESTRRDVESATEKVQKAEEKLAELRGKKASKESIADAEKDLKDARKDLTEATGEQSGAEKTLQDAQGRSAKTSADLYQATTLQASAQAMATGATKDAEDALKDFNAAQAEALAYAQKIAAAASNGSNVVSIFGADDGARAAEYARYAYDAAVAEAKATTEAGSMQSALDAVAAAGAKVAATQKAMGASYSTVSGTLQSTRDQVEALARSYGFTSEESQRLAASAVPLANSGQTLIDSLTQQLESVQRFSQSVDTLRKLGLSQALLDEVLEAGPAQGAQVAESILAGGKDLVGRLNSVQAQLDAASKSLGNSAASAAYGAGGGGLPSTGLVGLPQVTGGLTVSRGTRTASASPIVAGSSMSAPALERGARVTIVNNNTLTDTAIVGVVARQQSLELVGALSAVGA